MITQWYSVEVDDFAPVDVIWWNDNTITADYDNQLVTLAEYTENDEHQVVYWRVYIDGRASQLFVGKEFDHNVYVAAHEISDLRTECDDPIGAILLWYLAKASL